MRARDEHNGAWADTLVIHVDNNVEPEVLIVPMDIPDTITGKINLPLELTDIEGDTLHIFIQFSSYSGSTWNRGTPLGESNTLLPTTFTPTIRYTPTTIWDSVLDVGFVLDAATRLRFAAIDNDRSKWVESNDFIVNNLVGDFSGDFKIDFDDIAGFVDTWNSQDLVRETGPVADTSRVPNLIVTKDGVIDFEVEKLEICFDSETLLLS